MVSTFIFGTGRSGSTHLQRQLTLKTSTWIWGEHAGFLKSILASLPIYEDRPEMRNVVFDDIYHMSDGNLIECMMSDSHKLSWLNRMHRDELKDNLRILIKQMFASKLPLGWEHWGFKEIMYGVGDETPKYLLEIFPDAHFVFTFRKPEENVVSMLRTWTPKVLDERDSVADLKAMCDIRIKNWCRAVSYFVNLKKERRSVILVENTVIDDRIDDIIDRFGLTRVDRETGKLGRTNKGPSTELSPWAHEIIETELLKSRERLNELYTNAVISGEQDFAARY